MLVYSCAIQEFEGEKGKIEKERNDVQDILYRTRPHCPFQVIQFKNLLGDTICTIPITPMLLHEEDISGLYGLANFLLVQIVIIIIITSNYPCPSLFRINQFRLPSERSPVVFFCCF